MNTQFLELRENYPEFIYHDYKIEETKETMYITYHFEIKGLANFYPSLEIKKKSIPFASCKEEFINNLVFHIGLVELISYWKCVCSPNVIIKCGHLDQEQIDWFKKLYYNGLGEYRYINEIKISQEEMMKIKVEQQPKRIVEKTSQTMEGTIIPIGGGKDSTVTLELLKEEKDKNYCLIIGGKAPSIECAHIAGYTDEQIIEVTRTIDKNLLELNKQGFLNGHTPFSSLLAFLSYLIAYLTGRKYIALSNESSAEENNVEGEKINHQYSKSYEFENDFEYYAEHYLKANVQYFSLLRPLNELQIAKLFSQNEQYHSVFRSCNVGSKQIPWKWCGACPKCLFVYTILSPFLYQEKLVKIFGKDLFEDKELLQTFQELCGYGKTKPFECVGTYEEVNYAVTKTIDKLEEKNEQLPYLLQYYKEHYPLANMTEDITKRYNEKNKLPKKWNEMLKGKIRHD